MKLERRPKEVGFSQQLEAVVDFRADLPVQKVRRETGVEIDLGLDAGMGGGWGDIQRGERGIGYCCQHSWLVTGGGGFWYPG